MINRVNGKGKSINDLEGKEIEFPVTYKLKAVMIVADDEDGNTKKLVNVFTNLHIEHKYLNKKISSKGSYISYTYEVSIDSREQMNLLYAELKKIKELKFAV